MRRLLCLMIMLGFLTSCHIATPSNGQKIGSIVKLAKEGLIYKTWEGELIRGGMNDGSGSFGNIFHFVIEDQNLVTKALFAMENNKEIILIYHCEAFSSLARSERDGPNFVDDIIIK